MADPMGGERRVQKQRKLGLVLLLVCTVAACTRVRQQTDPVPAKPLPPVAHNNEPTRRPWPVAPSTVTQPPDAAPAVIDTLNGDPKGLKREDINNALQQALPTFAACFQGPGSPSSIGLSFDAEPDGRANNVKVTGASAEGERCVTATLGRTKLPVFEGKSVTVSFPISVYRPAAEVPTPAVAEKAAPAVPVAEAVPVGAQPGGSTTPYVPSSMAPTAGSKPDDNKVRTFIQP
jgi:hypothetical protein